MDEDMKELSNASASTESVNPEFLPGSQENSNENGALHTDSTGRRSSRRKSSRPMKTVITRVRGRNLKEWKRNQRKIKRLKGEEYVNADGRLFSAKKFQPCDSCCVQKCFEEFPRERQETLFKEFYSLGNSDLQTDYISSQIEVMEKAKCYAKNEEDSRRSSTFHYFLPKSYGNNVKVCKVFFKKVFQISDGRIYRVVKFGKEGKMPHQDQRETHPPKNKTPETNKIEVKGFIEMDLDSTKMSQMEREIIAKVLDRVKGEEYANAKGFAVSDKQFLLCDSCCVRKCYEELSGEDQENLFKAFYSIDSLDLQTAYLFSQIKVVDKARCYAKNDDAEESSNSRRSSTFHYYLPDSNGIEMRVCKEFFKKVFQVSDGRIARVAKIGKDGCIPNQD